ncbi:MAG: L,D-transpeptidase family protein [Epulopiscium sp.]|nr:L,D-transpeptidase family protein [Candidatus Epulonipiscium sp.]
MIFSKHIKKYILALGAIILLLCLTLFFQRYHRYQIEVDDGEAILSIQFMLPMNQEKIENYLKVYPQIPKTKYLLDYKWESNTQVRLKIAELEYPKGQTIILKVEGAPSYIPFLKKYFSMTIPFQIEPMIQQIHPEEQISTEGPIKVSFNTFMDPKTIDEYIESSMNLILEPIKTVVDNKKYTDYSQWLLYPNQKLKNDQSYTVIFKEGLEAQNGKKMKETMIKKFHTVSKPQIVKTTPKEDETWVSLYPKIRIETSEPIEKGYIFIEEMKGKIQIQGNKMEFLPEGVLRPDHIYQVQAQVTSFAGEKSDISSFTFTTMPLKEDFLWVEVSLKEYNEVIIYQGTKEIRRMKASGGRPEEPTVLGTFYLQDRGPYFFSERFGEGATYWVRIIDQYLFHGIPRDKNWNIIEEEEKKLGGAASHGCIRLSEEDAKWFYDNIPHGTMVIIHE